MVSTSGRSTPDTSEMYMASSYRMMAVCMLVVGKMANARAKERRLSRTHISPSTMESGGMTHGRDKALSMKNLPMNAMRDSFAEA